MFRVDHLVLPQTVVSHVYLPTGLHLSFGKGEKDDWWSWQVTKAAWVDSTSWLLWKAGRPVSLHPDRVTCIQTMGDRLTETVSESKGTLDTGGLAEGVGRVHITGSSNYTVEYRCAQGISAGK